MEFHVKGKVRDGRERQHRTAADGNALAEARRNSLTVRPRWALRPPLPLPSYWHRYQGR